MSAGLFGLLDDVASLAKLAAASVDDVGAAAGRATAKAAGVVVDDTAVTPQYVRGIAAARELPIIAKIAIGSLRNKLLIILPVALLLGELLPGLLPAILMLGGTYLAFEGAEKVWERFDGGHREEPSLLVDSPNEDTVVRSAIRTDLILSAEIMVIALDSVSDEGIWARLAILVVVALAITVGVYGFVALLVKMDDIGLALAARRRGSLSRLGTAMVSAMPAVLTAIGAIGAVAMLWVGGHILIVGAHDLGWDPPYDALHHVEQRVRDLVDVPVLGPSLAWLSGTLASALAGLVIGAVVVVVLHLMPRRSAPA
jgi:predicted DNA repair protein MutK